MTPAEIIYQRRVHVMERAAVVGPSRPAGRPRCPGHSRGSNAEAPWIRLRPRDPTA
jgi:hypothetical protein